MNPRYTILETRAGEGGFGRIDQAWDNLLERHVAIKTLDPLFQANPSVKDKERFKKEAKTLARLSHTNIPAIYDVQFAENGEFKLIFEWLEGMTIRDFLQQEGVLSLKQVKRWFTQIGSALAYAHRQGIIHRDIKPSNLIITTDRKACYLVDFGISLDQADLQRLTVTTAVGTPGYRSPQQERGETLDASDDVYSLGIVLYECLAGKRPSVGEYIPLNTLNSIIPPAIDDLVRSCLREDKQYRLSSVKEFVQAFLKALQPHAALSEILLEGSLSEIQKALSQMDSSQYAKLPRNYQILILAKLKQLIQVDQVPVKNGVASLLAELIRVGYRCSLEKDYAFIIANSLKYGYQRQYNQGDAGNLAIRKTLQSVAKKCPAPAHKILCEKLINFVEPKEQLVNQAEWFYEDLRRLLEHLLANSYCISGYAEPLGECLDLINELNHQHRPSE